jgi:hypothetical protein
MGGTPKATGKYVQLRWVNIHKVCNRWAAVGPSHVLHVVVVDPATAFQAFLRSRKANEKASDPRLAQRVLGCNRFNCRLPINHCILAIGAPCVEQQVVVSQQPVHIAAPCTCVQILQ